MSFEASHSLTNDEIHRYSRQLILDDFGVKGQQRLKESSVLIVGAGGLGCPVAIYLAGAGVGKIGIVDYDVVETNNLHRQVLHTQDRVDTSKAKSIQKSVLSLNPLIECIPFECQITSSNASELVNDYSVVADCSDNVATRYLLNDVCVMNNKPLVSGSALGWQGQLTVYNYGKDCPCYRCIYPTPPPPHTVTNCSDGGVLGPVVGVIGSLQASEIIKVITGIGSTYAKRLFVFDGLNCQTRVFSLRNRSKECVVCGDNPTVTELVDYEQFCGAGACDKIASKKLLELSERISAEQLNKLRKDQEPHLLIDTRPTHEYEIARIERSINMPLGVIQKADADQLTQELGLDLGNEKKHVYVICHRGNDSQEAVLLLKQKLLASNIKIKDVVGGLEAWTKNVDAKFPTY